MKNKSSGLRSLLNLSLLLIGMITMTSCWYQKIEPGSVGIKVNQWGGDRGVMDATECTGFVWYFPPKYDIYSMQTTVQHKEYKDKDAFVVNSKDGAEFPVSPILNYSVRADRAVEIFKTYKKELSELEDGFIKVAVYDAFRLAANSFTADSLIRSRELFEHRVRTILETTLTENGFIINQFTSNLRYPDSFKAAIEAKNAAVQNAQRADNEVKLAEANAKIAVAKATGEAQSLIIQARADAEANRLRQQSLTSTLIQQQFIEKWNGVLPQYGTTPQIFKQITN